jgi:hypothetical protein
MIKLNKNLILNDEFFIKKKIKKGIKNSILKDEIKKNKAKNIII